MRHLITAALPYINGIKHLGNLVGSMLPADVYARFLRQRGEEVLYVCGTDEHGAPAEIAAEESGEEVAAYCTRMHSAQSRIYQRFGISFDHFGRTSSQTNHRLTQRIFEQLDANGLIEGKKMRQFYSLEENRFLPDRYVMGTCPRCGYEKARGDQCENCTRLLDPLDLIDPRSARTESTALEIRESVHLFLKLSALQSRIRKWVDQQTEWPPLTRQVALKWLNEGLKDRCITRELRWGVSVPRPELAHLVFYVWFDAPIGYIGITREWAETHEQPDAWRSWWLDTEDVRYTEFMGKDNLPFHAVMFPAMLFGASKSWKLPDQIKGFHWLDYYRGKFSTSLQRGVFTDAALDLFPADYWRYGLLSMIPETSDSTFTWQLFAQAVNKDLADVLGNFVYRITRLSVRSFGGQTVPAGGQQGPEEEELRESCREALDEYVSALQELELRTALRSLRKLWTLGNQYVNARAPWKLVKTDPESAAMVVRVCFNLIALDAVASMPVIPTIAGRLLQMLHLDIETSGVPEDYLGLDRITGGHGFETAPPLVRRIEDGEVEALKARFGSEC